MTATITVTPRTSVSKKGNAQLRASGMVPAIVYGKKYTATPIALSTKEFEKLWRSAGESTLITIEGLGKPTDVLIHEVAVDPVLGTPIHVDFYAVDVSTEVTVSVPLLFEGVAPAEKELGGTLIKVLHDVEISALPKDLPHEIVVDISPLVTFDSQIHARDLVLPKGVKLAIDENEVVALVSEAKEEIDEAPPAAIDMSAIEVEKRGKQEEETPPEDQ